MIDRLAVRADEVDVLRRESRLLERRQAGRRECLADHDVQLGDAADVETGDPDDPAFHLGIVRVLAIVQQLDPDLGLLSRHPADGDVDRVGARAGHQAHDEARGLAAAFQEVSERMDHGVPPNQDTAALIL